MSQLAKSYHSPHFVTIYILTGEEQPHVYAFIVNNKLAAHQKEEGLLPPTVQREYKFGGSGNDLTILKGGRISAAWRRSRLRFHGSLRLARD